jgi:hypothetical protein
MEFPRLINRHLSNWFLKALSDVARVVASTIAAQALAERRLKWRGLAYVYGRETRANADLAHVLTIDEARRTTSNIAKLPHYLAANPGFHD